MSPSGWRCSLGCEVGYGMDRLRFLDARGRTRSALAIEKKQRAARPFASSFTPGSALGLFVRDQVIHLMNLPGVGSWAMSRMFKDSFSLPSFEGL